MKKIVKPYFGLQLAAFFFLPLILIQCTTENQEVWMQYIGTQCADPWSANSGDSDNTVKEAVTNYFGEKGIDVADIEIFFDAQYQEDCEACVCRSGKVIEIKIDENFVDEAEEEGFTEKTDE